MLLFLFLVAQALGSLIGGHLGDRFGRREIIWFSILGAVPFTLALAVRQPVLDGRPHRSSSA